MLSLQFSVSLHPGRQFTILKQFQYLTGDQEVRAVAQRLHHQRYRQGRSGGMPPPCRTWSAGQHVVCPLPYPPRPLDRRGEGHRGRRGRSAGGRQDAADHGQGPKRSAASCPVQAADNGKIIVSNIAETSDGELIDVGETERDLLRRQVGHEAEHLEQVRGRAVAKAFYHVVTTDSLTLREGLDAWLAEAARGSTRKTIDGHCRVFTELETWLRERQPDLSLEAMTFADISRRIAGEFIAHRSSKVSAAAVKREASATMGLWRWAVRRGHAETNPWSDQTAGLMVASRGHRREDDKRPFTVAEQLALLRASGSVWAPDGGGYGATLWDAVRLGLLTGLRIAELADLRIRDLVENSDSRFRPSRQDAQRPAPCPPAGRSPAGARPAIGRPARCVA